MKKGKYYHFETFKGEIITIYSNDYFKAETRATQYGQIKIYLGWTETLEEQPKETN